MEYSLHLAWRAIVLVVGLTILLLGIALLILPGPGWLVIAFGLVVLGSEFVWARRLLRRLKSELKETEVFVRQQLKRI